MLVLLRSVLLLLAALADDPPTLQLAQLQAADDETRQNVANFTAISSEMKRVRETYGSSIAEIKVADMQEDMLVQLFVRTLGKGDG